MTQPEGSGQSAGNEGGTGARRRRFSIGLLMTIVGLVAVDIAIVRGAWLHDGPSPAFWAMVMPVVDVLILALAKVGPGRVDRWLWRGFEAGGLASILVLAWMDDHAKPILFAPLAKVESHFGFPVNSPGQIALGVSCCILFYVPLQLLAAWLGGRLASSLAKGRPIG